MLPFGSHQAPRLHPALIQSPPLPLSLPPLGQTRGVREPECHILYGAVHRLMLAVTVYLDGRRASVALSLLLFFITLEPRVE